MLVDPRTGEIQSFPGNSKRGWWTINQARQAVDTRVVLKLALQKVQKRMTIAKESGRPRVRVFKTGRNWLFVLRVGDRYVSAYSWDRLIRKAAWDTWKWVSRSVSVKKRWK